MSIRSVFIVGVVFFGVGIALFGHAGIASAAYRRVHSSQCHYYYDDAGDGVYNGIYLYTSTARYIFCPAPSDSELPHSSTVWLNVHGYSPSASSAYSVACAKAYNTAAITCGIGKYWAPGYGGVYGVSVEAWSDGAAMPYVYSYLPAGASLYGFYMAT